MKYGILLISFFLFTQQFLFSKSKIEVFEENKDAVVRIYSMGEPGAGTSYYYSTGSGFAINDEGWVLTNSHVVEDAMGYYVVSHTDSEPDTSVAYVIWRNSKLDIAILKTELDIPYLKLTKPENISQGDEILILGFPGSDLNDHEIKVTSGILSSSTKDSSLMTTAPINPGNSGGPAINYNGEVVGQVYAKLVGLNVESTGFLRNIKYLENSLSEAKDSEISLAKSVGTSNYDVYKRMCLADAEYIKIHDTSDSLEQMKHVDNAIAMIRKALELEPDYGIARYYLVNYLFKKVQLHCEFDSEFDEETADKLIVEFHKEWKRAKNDSKNKDYADDINERIENKIYSLADADDIACYRWRDRVSSYSDYASAREARSDELQEYLYYGSTPYYLRQSLMNPTWERDRYKKYDALVNEIPLAVTINNYFSFHGVLGTGDLASTVSEVEIEVEPINELKVLLSVGVVANQILSPEELNLLPLDDPSDDENNFKAAESTPIKLGVIAYGFRARYNVTDVTNVLTRKWSLEYVPYIPGDGTGDVNSYSYVGVGKYDNDYDTDYAVNFGYAFEIYTSRVWIDTQVVLGFGRISELYQFGLGLGYRY